MNQSNALIAQLEHQISIDTRLLTILRALQAYGALECDGNVHRNGISDALDAVEYLSHTTRIK